MSLSQFWNALDGWTEREDFRQRYEWERARYIAKAIVSVQVEKKDRSKLDKAFRLPWDDEKKHIGPTRLSDEDLKKQEEKTIRMAEKLNKIL